MKSFKEIFGRIWALWFALAFIATMLLFLIPFLLFVHFRKDPRKSHIFNFCSRGWIDTFFFLVASPLTIRGKKNFVPGENYIVVCNHNSFSDILISSPSIQGGNKTIAKIELSRIPVFGMVYKSGSILVDRKSESSRRDSFTQMKEVLASGLHMCIYPEGTRNKTSQPLAPFHSGAFKLSKETGKGIIPALIFNTKKVLPADKTFYAMPHRQYIHFLPAVYPQQEESADDLRIRVAEIMKEYYVAHLGRP